MEGLSEGGVGLTGGGVEKGRGGADQWRGGADWGLAFTSKLSSSPS